MHLILCIDERDGLSFCGRRLSRDSRVIEHILKISEGAKLWMHPYSAKLFPSSSILPDEDFLHKAAEGDYCFVEISPVPVACNLLESVSLYCWNRAYPATVKFDRKLLDGMKLTHREEFSGNSHETITFERYHK